MHSDRDHIIDSVCSKLQAAWERGGPPPQLVDFIDTIPEDSLGEALGRLIRVDISMHRRRGLAPETAKYESLISTLDVASKKKVESMLDALLDSPETVVPLVRILGRYELRMEIGRGAFGNVYRSWDTELERFVAVKVPSARLTAEADRRLFLREAKAAAKLSADGIVRVLDFAVENDTAYIVFELIEGPSLATTIRHYRFEPLEAAALVAQVARSLSYAHSERVIHRDLKPGNILLDEHRRPWLTDFGLARVETDPETLHRTGQLLGTLQYMSPEQASGKAVEERSDVYSLGVVLYELLTGHRPFDDGDQLSLVNLINHVEAAPVRNANPKVAIDLETICHKAISKHPDDRYQSAAELADDLDRFLTNEPILARPLSKFGRLRRTIERHPVNAVLLLAVVIVTGVAAAAVSRPAKEIVREKIVEVPPIRDGRLPVQFVTEPTGASLTLIRLDDELHEPDPSTLQKLPGRTPLTHRLEEGFYLVVATLDDGRFHEVIRRVPEVETRRRGIGPAIMSWEFTDGRVEYVSPLVIPDSPTLDMAMCEPHVNAGLNAPFYVATNEYRNSDVTRRDWLDAKGERHPEGDHQIRNLPFRTEYWIAAQIAERAGGRLPSLLEWNALISVLPDSPCVMVPEIRDVDADSCDVIQLDKPVLGIAGNVPEWLSTRAGEMVFDLPPGASGILPSWGARQYIGGSTVDYPLDYVEQRGTLTTTSRIEFDAVGFRVVRSAKPRTSPTDFPPLDAFRDAIKKHEATKFESGD